MEDINSALANNKKVVIIISAIVIFLALIGIIKSCRYSSSNQYDITEISTKIDSIQNTNKRIENNVLILRTEVQSNIITTIEESNKVNSEISKLKEEIQTTKVTLDRIEREIIEVSKKR